MGRRTWIAAGLLFCSGLSALIYQTVWLREFRLVFGASTFATAAVLAIFMGGLGVGSAILGKRADERAGGARRSRRRCPAPPIRRARLLGTLAKRANEEWTEYNAAEPESLSPR